MAWLLYLAMLKKTTVALIKNCERMSECAGNFMVVDASGRDEALESGSRKYVHIHGTCTCILYCLL